MKPLAIDLYCGLGGWAEGFLAEGYRVIGFDIEAHDYGTGGYPGGLVLRDVRSIHGSEFKDAAVIVASPPCQAYSYRAMPWKRAKALPPPDNTLFNECFRIQREANMEISDWCVCGHRRIYHALGEETGCLRYGATLCECDSFRRRYIPLIVENVRGAQKWVGRARWHFGSYYLWGDVPALMPMTFPQKFNPDGTAHGPGSWFAIADSKNRGAHTKNDGGSWFAVAHNTTSGKGQNTDGRKVPGINFNDKRSPGFNVTAAQRYREEFKQKGSGAEWFDNGLCTKSSNSDSRKAASAQIAKIPFPLAQHIARCFKDAA